MYKLLITVAVLTLTTSSAYAQDSVSNVSNAIGDSAVSTARLSEAGIKVVVGTAAVPFVVVGFIAEGTGAIMRESGTAVWDSANAPLKISPETIVAQPAPHVPYAAIHKQYGH